jgi:hypothetical protein
MRLEEQTTLSTDQNFQTTIIPKAILNYCYEISNLWMYKNYAQHQLTNINNHVGHVFYLHIYHQVHNLDGLK